MSFLKKQQGSIPFNRLAIYLIILSFLPIVCLKYQFAKKKQEWEAVLNKTFAVSQLSEAKSRKQALNNLARTHYGEADHFYLDNQLETLSFQKKESDALEKLIRNPGFTGNEGAERRYAALTGEANRLHFTEGSIQSGDRVQETTAVLTHAVEIDTHDLREILNRIEGQRKGKPLLLISDFKLAKKISPNGNEVFDLNLKLLKREFVQ